MLSQTAQKATTGLYRVQEGDTPASIAQKLYGDVHKAPVILNANGYGWETGDVIEIPNFTGFVMTAQRGEQFTALFRRAFNGTTASGAAKDEFFKWNGREVSPGQQVFFVDVRKKSYGY